jgi:hypothetical protein
MPGAVADVVADVVGDHGRVARVVLGDPRLDLPDEVGADVGGLREDAAAEAAAKTEISEPPKARPIRSSTADSGELSNTS